MIVKVLMENTAVNPAFHAEHGLSLYIEANGSKILFDAGQSPAFAENAETLDVDLSQVDFAVLSHAHYDHSGGMQTFLSLNDHAPVYVSPYAFDEYLHGTDKYIGVDPALQGNPRLQPVAEPLRVADGVAILPREGHSYVHPIESYGLNVRRKGVISPDDFRHEQYLLITEGDRRILISGCSHRGIVNIVHWFHPDVLIGGFHLMKLDPQGDGQEALDQVASELLAYPTVYHTCHCTGVPQYEYLKPKMGDRLFYISAGQEITV